MITHSPADVARNRLDIGKALITGPNNAKDRLVRWRYRQKQAEQGAEPLLEIWRG